MPLLPPATLRIEVNRRPAKRRVRNEAKAEQSVLLAVAIEAKAGKDQRGGAGMAVGQPWGSRRKQSQGSRSCAYKSGKRAMGWRRSSREA
jgi:hypothetical protein